MGLNAIKAEEQVEGEKCAFGEGSQSASDFEGEDRLEYMCILFGCSLAEVYAHTLKYKGEVQVEEIFSTKNLELGSELFHAAEGAERYVEMKKRAKYSSAEEPLIEDLKR